MRKWVGCFVIAACTWLSAAVPAGASPGGEHPAPRSGAAPVHS
jgi:hypothetical protein